MASDGLWYPPTATPYQAPPPGLGNPNNGMGIAAMVLGIVGAAVGLFWPLAVAALVMGVLALVLGLVARGRAAKFGLPGGQALAGVILGIVALGLAGYGFWVQSRVVDAVTSLFGNAGVEANATVNRMTITRCTTEAGDPVADGTLVNTSSETRSYRVYVVFRDVNGIGPTAVGYTGQVAPRGTATWTARGYGGSYPGFTGCALIRDPATAGTPGATDGFRATPATPGS